LANRSSESEQAPLGKKAADTPDIYRASTKDTDMKKDTDTKLGTGTDTTTAADKMGIDRQDTDSSVDCSRTGTDRPAGMKAGTTDTSRGSTGDEPELANCRLNGRPAREGQKVVGPTSWSSSSCPDWWTHARVL
jgi:hypothetical protein